MGEVRRSCFKEHGSWNVKIRRAEQSEVVIYMISNLSEWCPTFEKPLVKGMLVLFLFAFVVLYDNGLCWPISISLEFNMINEARQVEYMRSIKGIIVVHIQHHILIMAAYLRCHLQKAVTDTFPLHSGMPLKLVELIILARNNAISSTS